MTFLLVQTFLLLLGAFLLGASLACLIRRALAGRRAADEEITALGGSPALSSVAAPTATAAAPMFETNRFGRALAGQSGHVSPGLHGGEPSSPVIEVQPPPERPRAAAAAPAPPPEPAVAEAPASAVKEPVTAPPAAAPPAAAPAEPRAAEPAARAPEPPPQAAKPAETPSAGEPYKPVAGRSYTEIAVAAAAVAAAAAAAKAAAEAEAEEAARAAEEAALAAAYDDPADEDAALPGEPAAETALPGAIAPGGVSDDLTRIRFIDADLKARLNRHGIHTFAAIAAWTADDVRLANQTLGFHGRIEDENWIEQAQILARGGDAGGPRAREATPLSETHAPVDDDRLHRIIGLDPQAEAWLNAHGVTRIAQIAAWSDDDAAAFERLLGLPEGRVAGQGWIEQARYLARADRGEGLAPAQAGTSVPVTTASAPDPAPEASFSDTEPVSARPPHADGAPRDGLTGLRSVRSEALVSSGAAGSAGSGSVDDLKRIRGIGVLIEKKLNSLGITAYDQVANWTDADIDRISQLLDFKGRIERENWIEQARILASGGQTEFSRRVDRGEA